MSHRAMTLEERDLILERRMTVQETKMDEVIRTVSEFKTVIEKTKVPMYLLTASGPIITAVLVYYLTH